MKRRRRGNLISVLGLLGELPSTGYIYTEGIGETLRTKGRIDHVQRRVENLSIKGATREANRGTRNQAQGTIGEVCDMRECAIGLKESTRERGIRRVRDDDGEDSAMGRNYVRTA